MRLLMKRDGMKALSGVLFCMMWVFAACAENSKTGIKNGGNTDAGLGDGGVAVASDTGQEEGESTDGSDDAVVGVELMRADFQDQSPGSYAQSMVVDDFGVAPSWNNGLDEGRGVIVEEAGERFLRVTFTGEAYGPNDGGVQFMLPLNDSYESLYLSYRVRFAEGFEFVKGGKLPGLVGGSAPTGCVDDTDGFSARMMWRTGGAAVQYMYFPEKRNDCGDDYDYMSVDDSVHFAPGEWHVVVHRLQLNTPGATDGILQAWFDGNLVLDEQAFLYRLSDKSYGIDALYFSTFFGGGDDSWAPSTDQIVDFDDFVISTGPIL